MAKIPFEVGEAFLAIRYRRLVGWPARGSGATASRPRLPLSTGPYDDRDPFYLRVLLMYLEHGNSHLQLSRPEQRRYGCGGHPVARPVPAGLGG